MRHTLFLILLSLALTGCDTVSNMGDRAAAITSRGGASLQASFSSFTPSFSGGKESRSGFGIRSIDGVALPGVYIGAVHELRPGKHSIEILATRQRGGITSLPSDSMLGAVEFTAEAGGSYQAAGRISEKDAEVWIAELQSGRIVSSVVRGDLVTTETKVPAPVIIMPK